VNVSSGKRKPRSRRPRQGSRPGQKTKQRQTESHQRPPVEGKIPLWLHGVRLAIVFMGMSTIGGTILGKSHSVKNPPSKPTQIAVDARADTLAPLILKQPMVDLNDRLQGLISKYPKLQVSGMFIDVNGGNYVAIDADRSMPASRLIELPILVALYQDIERQKISLEEQLPIKDSPLSDSLEHQPLQIQMSVVGAISKMLGNGDPTATNLLIKKLGGKEVLTQRFRKWGLKVTAIDRIAPDNQGSNLTTVRELATLIVAIDRGQLLSDKSRTEVLNILRQTTPTATRPAGLATDAKVISKTIEVPATAIDFNAIELSGRNYISITIVNRPNQDPSAIELTRQISEIAYPQLWRSPNLSNDLSDGFIN
jgi:beta-lactamase class A